MGVTEAPLNDLLMVTKTVNFNGTAGRGAIGNVPVFTVGGYVLIEKITAVCTGSLVGPLAQISLGVVGATSMLIASTLATPVSGGASVPASMLNVVSKANVVGTVTAADITGGSMRFTVLWRPVSASGTVVAA